MQALAMALEIPWHYIDDFCKNPMGTFYHLEWVQPFGADANEAFYTMLHYPPSLARHRRTSAVSFHQYSFYSGWLIFQLWGAS